MKRLLTISIAIATAIAMVVSLGACVSDGAGTSTPHGAVAAGGFRGAVNWVPKPGLVATVIVMEPEKFYKLANTMRPDLANRPVSGLAYFNKKKCIIWVRSDLSPTDFRLNLAHELRHCQEGQYHRD
jgi:hypothetical protein